MNAQEAYDVIRAAADGQQARALVRIAHPEAHVGLCEDGFQVARVTAASALDVGAGCALTQATVFTDGFCGNELVLCTELYVTAEADSYGCAYLSWQVHREAPPRLNVDERRLAIIQLFEGRGVAHPDSPAHAREAIEASLLAGLGNPAVLDLERRGQGLREELAQRLTP